MDILITGADGFIGSHLSEYLGKRHDLLRIVRSPAGYGSKPPRGVKALDLTDEKKTREFSRDLAKRRGIDAIVHLAFNLASSDNADDIGSFHKNVKVTKNMVEMAKALRPKKLINFSSMAVYPNRDGVYSEASAANPVGNSDFLYGLSKFCAEAIFDHFLGDTGITVTHLRVSQIYGSGMRGDRIMPVMLKELKEKNTITVHGNGERISNFIDIGDLVKRVEFFIRKDLAGVYNVGDENLSYLALAGKLIRLYGNGGSKIVKVSRGSRARFRLDTGKLERIFSKSRRSS